jgi:type 1 fimbria pilin
MKIYKTQQEVEKDIKDGVLTIQGDVTFECSISIDASIIVTDGNINAEDINAWDINAEDITAEDINAEDINAWDITAGDITAKNITAGDITARDITAWDITAKEISYHAFCCVYGSIKCKSIKARRTKHHKPICLDGKLTIK